jgi:glucose-6-phosphate dehydrogenase assembly protein OpcA
MPASAPPEKIKPEKVLRDLRDLWAQLASNQEESGSVLRACAMTLLVVAHDEDAAERVRRILGGVMHDHPCRAIVLRMSPGAGLAARVFAECWMPSGSHKQICAEGIELTADALHLEDAAQLALPLIVPDLPVMVWFHGAGALSREMYAADPLLKLAQKVIVDSGAPSAIGPASGIAAVRALRSPSRRVADLAWTRLTGWRESIANAFTCNRSWVISGVHIQYAGAESTSMLYFQRWIERAVPSARITLEPVSGAGGLRSVSLSGGNDSVTVALSGPVSGPVSGEAAIEVTVGDKRARSPLPSTSEEALMREELSIPGADPVFEAVLDATP